MTDEPLSLTWDVLVPFFLLGAIAAFVAWLALGDIW